MAEQVHYEILEILKDPAKREALKQEPPVATLKEINPVLNACLEEYEAAMVVPPASTNQH